MTGDDLRAAKSGDAALRMLSRRVHELDRLSGSPRIWSEGDMIENWARFSSEAHAEVQKRMSSLMSVLLSEDGSAWFWKFKTVVEDDGHLRLNIRGERPVTAAEQAAGAELRAKHGNAWPAPDNLLVGCPVGPLDFLQKLWRPVREVTHPLTPYVRELNRLEPSTVNWDESRHTNVPGPVARTRHLAHATEPRDGQIALPIDYEYTTPAPPENEPRIEVGYLPTLDPGTSLLALALLNMFSGAASRGRSGPVPVPARIGWEVLVALGGDDRERVGGPALLECTLMDLHRMVFPATARWDDRNGDRLLRGLSDLDAARVRWRGDAAGGLYPLVEVYRLPTDALPGEPVSFLSHLPPGSRQGPQVDRVELRHLAAISARQHRAMLAAYVLWDQRATVKGHLVQLTKPVVLRDRAGYVLDAEGNLVTERGKATRRPTHPKAVQTGAREPNQAALSAYPWLEGDDVILVAHRSVEAAKGRRNEQRRLTLVTLEALRRRGSFGFEVRYRADSVVTGDDLAELEKKDRPPHSEVEAVRLLPSPSHFAAHQARREERQLRRRAR